MFNIEKWARSVLSEKDYRELDEKIFTIRKVVVLCAIYTQIFLVLPSLSMHHFRHWGENFFQTIPFFKDHPILGFVVGVGNMSLLMLGGLSYLHLEWAFKDFVKKSKLQELITTIREMSGGEIMVYPKFKDFFFSQSLQSFEDHYVQLYTDHRRELIKLKHLEHEREKIQKRIGRIEQEMRNLEKQFSDAITSVTSEKDAADYKQRFQKAPTREEAKAVISEIQSKAEERQKIEKRRMAKISGLKGHLAALSNQNPCPEAKHFYDLAEDIPVPKDKIEALKQAIELQKAFNKREKSKLENQDNREALLS